MGPLPEEEILPFFIGYRVEFVDESRLATYYTHNELYNLAKEPNFRNQCDYFTRYMFFPTLSVWDKNQMSGLVSSDTKIQEPGLDDTAYEECYFGEMCTLEEFSQDNQILFIQHKTEIEAFEKTDGANPFILQRTIQDPQLLELIAHDNACYLAFNENLACVFCEDIELEEDKQKYTKWGYEFCSEEDMRDFLYEFEGNMAAMNYLETPQKIAPYQIN
jgi:hypothetical protein